MTKLSEEHGQVDVRACDRSPNVGERVMLNVLNADATENYHLELPGHDFEVTALDGHPLPAPSRVGCDCTTRLIGRMDTSPPERGENIAQTATWRRKFPSRPDRGPGGVFPADLAF